MKKYTTEVIEAEGGELAIQFSADMLKQMGWDEQTLLEWTIEENCVYIKEKENVGS